jgi:hypothetical protein
MMKTVRIVLLAVVAAVSVAIALAWPRADFVPASNACWSYGKRMSCGLFAWRCGGRLRKYANSASASARVIFV